METGRPKPGGSEQSNDHVEDFHSRNGLSHDRMGSGAQVFDIQLGSIIEMYQPKPILEFELIAEVAWGIPKGKLLTVARAQNKRHDSGMAAVSLFVSDSQSLTCSAGRRHREVDVLP